MLEASDLTQEVVELKSQTSTAHLYQKYLVERILDWCHHTYDVAYPDVPNPLSLEVVERILALVLHM